MMLLEGCHIEDAVFMDKDNFVLPFSIVPNFFKVLELQVATHHKNNDLMDIKPW